jgi:Peptidase C39 family
LIFIAAAGWALPTLSHAAAGPSRIPAAQPVEWRHTKRCGLNCLYVMLRMIGAQVSYQTLGSEVQVTDQGTTMAELVRVAALHGAILQPMRATKESIPQWSLPAIIHLQNQDLTAHYVLLLRSTGNGFVVLDCNSGELREWGAGEFLDKWTGYVLMQPPPGLLFTPIAASLWVGFGCAVLGLGLWQWMLRPRHGLRPPPVCPVDKPNTSIHNPLLSDQLSHL